MTRQEINHKYPKRNGFYYGMKDNKEYKYPSITGILGCFSKEFLIVWAAKKCVEIALDDPTLTVDEVYRLHRQRDVISAGTRGKGVHNIAPKLLDMAYNSDKEIEVPVQYKPYIDGLIKFIKENQPRQIFNEQSIISHKHGIGGTCDWGLIIRGKRGIYDIKTSKQVYKTHLLQNQFYFDTFKENGDEYEECKIIHLPGNGTYNLIDVREDTSILVHLKKAYEWQKET